MVIPLTEKKCCLAVKSALPHMKHLLLSLLLMMIVGVGRAQTDPELEQRVNRFVKNFNQFNFDSIFAYTYPKLFTLFPRDEMESVMRKSMDGEESGMRVKIDSTTIDSILPVLNHGGGQYARIESRIAMRLMLLPGGEFDLEDTVELKRMAEVMGNSMEQARPGVRVRFDLEQKTLHVNTPSTMIAARDAHSREWTFVNLSDNTEILNKLFDPEMLKKLL